jgi:tetratricopeptide (TPR) repeat protein
VPRIAEARALLGAQRNEEALAVSTAALAVAPGEPRVLLVHAEANLRVGERSGSRERIEEALRSFLRAGSGAETWLGACRAARGLGKTAEALEYARQARATLGSGVPASTEEPTYTIARALWDAYSSSAASGSADAALRDEAASALASCAGALPRELWAWQRLADVEEARGDLAAAQQALERALESAPLDREVPPALARVARAHGASGELIAAFERARPHAAGNVDIWWIPALERLGSTSLAPRERIAELRTAEREFAAARTIDPSLRTRSLRMEAACRAGVGWAELARGDLAAACDSFRSMEKLERGAMAYSHSPQLESGVLGLAAVAVECERRGEGAKAATLALELHRYEPDAVRWALESGRLHRTLAERTHADAEEFQLAADERIREPRRLLALRERAAISATIPIGPRLATEFRIRAEELRKSARKQFETAYRSLLDASRLEPSNVRAMADAALLAIEYLRTDDDIARGLLGVAIALGERQLAASDLDEAERVRLTQAWGDAHEYMGLFYLERKSDPRTALGYFESSLRIGPSARPSVQDVYLPRCKAALQRRN